MKAFYNNRFFWTVIATVVILSMIVAPLISLTSR